MEKTIKAMIIIFMVIYVISPLDVCPGPIDDILVMVISMAASKSKMLNQEKAAEYIDV